MVRTTRELPRRVRRMHAAHGRIDGARCGECAQLVAVPIDHVGYRCRRAVPLAGEGTVGWSPAWPACGLFEPATGA